MFLTDKKKEIRTIAFIEPRNEHLHIYTRFELPRIGSLLLATIMRDLGYQTKAYFLKANEIKKRNLKPDLVCISTITTTAFTAYELALYYRQQGIPVVIGGPHVTALPEEAIQYSDFVIVGEGEKSLPLLVQALQGKGDMEKIPGLYWKLDDIVHTNIPNSFIEDLDANPAPDWSLIDYGDLRLGGNPKKITIPVQTSRGCPHDCSFCSVTKSFGRKYRYRSTESIIEELKNYDANKHILFFVDDNFTASRTRSIELLDTMIDNDFKFIWSTQVRVEVAKDPELLYKMYKAGCRYLYIGFESVNPESLVEMNKHQTKEAIEFAIREIRKANLHIHGMFVFGFDSDTPKSCRETVKFAISNKIDTVQFLILTPLPGTRFYYRMMKENRILDKNWSEYDAHHAKFLAKNFTLLKLQKMQLWGHGRFYSWFQNILRLIHGKISAFIIGIYAHALNRKWKRQEKRYLRKMRIYDAYYKLKGEEDYLQLVAH